MLQTCCLSPFHCNVLFLPNYSVLDSLIFFFCFLGFVSYLEKPSLLQNYFSQHFSRFLVKFKSPEIILGQKSALMYVFSALALGSMIQISQVPGLLAHCLL